MTKAAFEKIKAGLEDAKAYLDGSADRRDFGIHVSAGTNPVRSAWREKTEDIVNDYHALRDYLKKQTLPELVLTFEEIEAIIDASLPRAAHRASWWETLRSPQEKMPQREACLAAGYVATRRADGNSVKFKRMKNRIQP